MFFDVAGYNKGSTLEKLAVPSAPVVKAGLEALSRNQAVAIPGTFNKVGAQAHRFLPRSLLRKVVTLVKS